MFGSDLLGVVVGLILLYLLLSVLASAANEMVESVLKYRARYLERGLREMLGDPNGTTLVRALYEHPLIFGLFKGNYNPDSPGNLPSYIPAKTFALAITDLFLGEPTQAVPLPPRAAKLGLIDVPLSSRTQVGGAPIEPPEPARSPEPSPTPD